MSKVPPILLSAVICEKVIFDKISGLPSLINIIQDLHSSKYPARNWHPVFFCEMTNGHASAEATIRLVDAQNDDRIVFEQKGSINFKDVRQIVTLAVNLHGIVFPHPGQYRFQLFADGRLMGERRINCKKIRKPPRPDSDIQKD